MRIYIFLLLFATSCFAIEDKNISYTNKNNKIIEISKIILNGSNFVKKNDIKKILTDDLFLQLLPYDIPFLKLKVNKSNIENCDNLIKNYLSTQGYIHSSVQCKYNSKQHILSVNIKDGNPVIINSVSIKNDYEGFKNCSNEKLCLKSGLIFSKKSIEKFKKNLSFKLENDGYIFNSIKINPYYLNDEFVNLDVKIEKKKKIFIGKIILDIKGNISPNIVDSLLFFKQGDVFKYSIIRDSINNLKSKHVFDYITITPLFNKMTSDILPIKITLSVKKKTKKIKASVGFDSFEGPKFSLEWNNYMFLNNMKSLGLKTDISKYVQNVETSFLFPFFLSKYKINLYNHFGYKRTNTSLFQNEYIYDNVFLNRTFRKLEINLGFNTIFNRPLNKTDLSIYKDIVISLFQNIKFYEVDDVFFPKLGYKIETEIESSILMSSFDFLELKLGLAGYYPLLKDKNLYLSGKFNFDNIKSDTNIINIKRPFSGGYNSNRGYGFQSITESSFTNSIVKIDSSLEIKYEFYNNTYLFLFDDYTNIDNSVYNSTGIGGYYNSPMGVFSVGISHNSDKDIRFFLSIGTSF